MSISARCATSGRLDGFAMRVGARRKAWTPIEQARKQEDDPVRHVGDEGVENQGKEQQFTQANANSTTLDEVREALKRIENGTFGTKCVVGQQFNLSDRQKWLV